MRKDARGDAILVLFARAPRAGGVKTRLAGAIGDAAALDLHRAFLLDTIHTMHRASHEGVVRTVWFSEPWEPDEEVSRALDGIAVGAQPPGELGERMQACLLDLLTGGYRRVVILGADSPTLPVKFIVRAVTALADRDVVLGPADDGGYYLVGARTVIPEMFRGIAWGGPSVYADTVRVLRLLGAAPVELPPWHDVDTAEDLTRLRADLASWPPAGAEGEPPPRETIRALARLDSGA